MIKVFDIKKQIELKNTLVGHTQWVWDIALSKDSKFLISVSSDGSVKLWSIESGKIIKDFFNE